MQAYKILKILSVLIIPFLNISCQEKKSIDGIEIIADYDSGYLTPMEVNIKPGAQKTEAFNKIENEAKPKKLFSEVVPGDHLFLYELYLNENGTLDKIRIVEGLGNNFDKELISQMKNWKYEPAKRNNENVKSRFISFWKLSLDSQGGYSLTSYDNISETKNTMTSNVGYYTEVDEMPSPTGGEAAFMKFLAENIQYPEIAKRAGIEGRVYVKAYVDENGNIAATEVLKGVGYGMDEAAVEAVKKLKFNPGKQNGKPVKVQIVIPIMFKLG